MSQKKTPKQHDVIVVGGGLNGLTQALAFAYHGVRVLLLEASPLDALLAPKYDGRTSAVSHAGVQLFKKLGVWDALKDGAGPIQDIRICDGDSPRVIDYQAAAVSDEPMGYILENLDIRRALYQALLASPLVTCMSPARVANFSADAFFATLYLEDGTSLQAKLVVAADGKRSMLRELVGIRCRVRDYKQTALITNIRHSKPHHATALERFLPAGPFASLPMHDPHMSSIVWTERASLAEHYAALPEKEFAAEIAERLGDWLGEVSIAGHIAAYPLSLIVPEEQIAERLVLVGDAAHGIHPIAGQGYNLGIRDVAWLSEIVAEQVQLGLDPGAANVLQAYRAKRKADQWKLIASTDSLNLLFSNHNPLLRAVRRFGLGSVNRMPGLKAFFQIEAMGYSDELPQLMKVA